jgi:hypothetical protein
MRVGFDKTGNEVGDVVDEVLPVGLSLDCLELHRFYLSDNQVVYSHKFVDDRIVF